MTAIDPSVAELTGLNLVIAPGTPPLGKPTDKPLPEAFQAFLKATEDDPQSRHWLPLLVQNTASLSWARLRVFPDLETWAGFTENSTRFRCAGTAKVLHDDGTDGAEFRFNLELSIVDGKPRDNLGTITLHQLSGR
jgi:hypothetical protein